MKRFAKKAFLAFVLCLAGLAFAEGVCSLAFFAYAFVTTDPSFTKEREHTRYDELLGWSHVPDLYIGDLYGPGIYLKINRQGFRNDEDVSVEAPPSAVRLICSGDSFTLGYGVANDRTWCHQLSELEPRLQTVNMGQGGYGMDQAYLWYMRDGRPLQHRLHLFAFITADFGRMGAADFRGYGKPVLSVENSLLVTGNVPVPRRAYLAPWLTEKLRDFQQLQLFQALRMGVRLVAPRNPEQTSLQTRAVASKLFESLREANREKGSLLALVYLPIRNDYDTDVATEMRAYVASEARRLGIPLLDLVEVYKQSPRGGTGRMFRRDGHYTELGNEFFARKLLEGLEALPEFEAHLQPAPPS